MHAGEVHGLHPLVIHIVNRVVRHFHDLEEGQLTAHQVVEIVDSVAIEGDFFQPG